MPSGFAKLRRGSTQGYGEARIRSTIRGFPAFVSRRVTGFRAFSPRPPRDSAKSCRRDITSVREVAVGAVYASKVARRSTNDEDQLAGEMGYGTCPPGDRSWSAAVQALGAGAGDGDCVAATRAARRLPARDLTSDVPGHRLRVADQRHDSVRVATIHGLPHGGGSDQDRSA